jgi:hypothetical protein
MIKGTAMTAQISDDDLRSQTILMGDAMGAQKTLIIGCGAIAREILAIKQANGWDHLDLLCLPAIWHNTPDKIPQGVADMVQKHRDSYAQIFVAYADCGTGGMLQKTCDDLGVQMIKGPHCYAFFQGDTMFAGHEDADITAFYLTDFLARQFDAFVWRPLGLDRHPQLLDSYFGHYDRLVYLAQIDDPQLTQKAQDCADRMGLHFERRITGYGDLTQWMGAAAQPQNS